MTYLEKRGETDYLFAESFANPNKNIDDCCTYILNEIQKSGCNSFHDDEDTIEVGEPINHAYLISI